MLTVLRLIDWHSHVLHQIDDGSRNVAESISMIEALASQGVSTVIATPHFYADDDSVASFLEKRNKACEELKKQLDENSPQILLGAEVKYYQGISRMENLRDLCIEDSKLLLLEMPISRWTEYTVKELSELSCKADMEIILAHFERYIGYQKRSVCERIIEDGILMQANASFFISPASRRKAVSWLEQGLIHFLGSDCHNMTSRPPRIGKAFDVISREFSDNYLYQMNEYGHAMLEHIKTNYFERMK